MVTVKTQCRINILELAELRSYLSLERQKYNANEVTCPQIIYKWCAGEKGDEFFSATVHAQAMLCSSVPCTKMTEMGVEIEGLVNGFFVTAVKSLLDVDVCERY